MASPKFYVLKREPQGGFSGSLVIINRATLSPTGDGPWPLSAQGYQHAYTTCKRLNSRPTNTCGTSVVHANGMVTFIHKYVGPNGRSLWRLSGQGVDGRRLSSKDWISYEAALHEASQDRVRAAGGRVLAASGSGPKAKNKPSLFEIERRRKIAKEF